MQHPQLQWRDDGQPIAIAFDDPYFSVEDGLAESRHVFLHNNGLPQRWQNWQGPFGIIETGFGSGLNFIMSWQAFAAEASDDCWLHYTSIEKFPMSRQQLQQAASLWPELAHWYAQLLEQYPLPVAGFHSLCWPEQRIQLTLIFADVHEALPQLQGPVNAWFLDGFAPSRNPEMWQQPLFDHIRRICRQQPPQIDNTTVATFTSAGIVRRGLKGAGFRVAKVKGFGRKREMLAGSYQQTLGPEQPACFSNTPWGLTPALPCPRKVIVIGAGLAGCTTARALAERGIQVELIDRHGIASEASGNPQGGLYIKLAANDQATHTHFYLAAYFTSLRWMQRLLDNKQWDDCGVLQLGYNDAELQRQQKFMQAINYPDELIQPCDSNHASELAGSTNNKGGLLFPAAGWVSPAELCQQLVQHGNIRFHQADIDSIRQTDNGHWQAISKNHQAFEADQLVVANAYSARQLLPDSYLPVKSIRGQLTYLNPTLTPTLSAVLCGRSYMAPERDNRIVMGATYNLRDDNTDVRDSDHQENLRHLADFGEQWQQLAEAALANQQDFDQLVVGGRTAFRCTTPDYLPMTGAVVNTAAFVAAYQPMVNNAKRIPAVAAPVHTGLWLNIGHGSRGLASTPLCAELLAGKISGSGSPTSQAIELALLPARFLLRDMIRKKLPAELSGSPEKMSS
ncbi:bifunctional tRNA (5-methylaminomethyl-2-thiouridine)(34)-methyltransferase MnmD/FAD-dependent 5-carboxymethylaminomethyl-2-thiouridine(34) oxidoreductase MnmC [Oceanobacter mangrovi]|uniref:bifunctional tRNA (5-methylaminomethyl-2-thiouridine)(34)-methyltransferase MnmD/FAD-dependent 5-carboxymethylaminomethyl-2-thiouridine(34) oxidoreductase MnmC n=1 Tax=Oceanobacter mangrovi TaxID=2862510 RepID=UPI001C8E252D|nr:bifunctional tRNA (5-methylaminomethyl-2-thiouridine)(34)-methyltransferase MnmD/FAD-dependent 5-carboxymethylaminomethyl-2-thiouridine(34) oxidoreductase MnmC [Oceanobacter mangrovi]